MQREGSFTADAQPNQVLERVARVDVDPRAAADTRDGSVNGRVDDHREAVVCGCALHDRLRVLGPALVEVRSAAASQPPPTARQPAKTDRQTVRFNDLSCSQSGLLLACSYTVRTSRLKSSGAVEASTGGVASTTRCGGRTGAARRWCSSARHVPANNASLFSQLSYVCPEPVLAK